MTTKSDSMNNVTSCQQVESTVLGAQIEKIWENMKSFNFHKFLSTHIKNVKFTSKVQLKLVQSLKFSTPMDPYGPSE